MWTLVCGADIKEQRMISLLYSLSNNSKNTLSNLTSVELHTENDVLLEKIDAVFQSEDVENA